LVRIGGAVQDTFVKRIGVLELPFARQAIRFIGEGGKGIQGKLFGIPIAQPGLILARQAGPR